MEDSEIVGLYLARSESAVQETQQKYGSRLRNFSFRIVNDRQCAEECENDTYLAAWKSIPPHEPKHYLYAFLARITRHLSLNCCRNRSRLCRSAFLCEFSAEMEQCIPAPDDCACRMDEIAFGQVLNRFLGRLPARSRGIFLRRYFYFDSVKAVAARYSLPENTVKSILLRTRKQLHDFLEEEGYIL